MQVSEISREVAQAFVFELIKVENRLYTRLKYLFELKGSLADKFFSETINEFRLKSYNKKSELIDKEIFPISEQHQKVLDKLKTFGVIVSHN